MEIQQNNQLNPASPQTQSKRWYKHKGLLTIAILLVVVTVVVGLCSKKNKFSEENFEIKSKAITPADATLQNVIFSVPAKGLNIYPLVEKDNKPDEIVSATLRGNFYEPPENLQSLTRSNANLSTALGAIQTFFSANKSGDFDWILSLWVPEERQQLKDKLNTKLEGSGTNPLYVGKTYGQANTEIFQKYSSVNVKAVAYYKDYAFVVATYQPDGQFTIAYTFKKTDEGWLTTNYLSTTLSNRIKAGDKDLTESIVWSAAQVGTIEVKK
jgi:hypothetical protein